MKKVVLILLAVFMISNVTAQIKIGPTAGANFTNITGDEADSFEGMVDLFFGVVAPITIDDTFSVQPGLIYSRQGADYEDTFSDGEFSETYTGTVKLGYLNVPVLARVQVAEGLTLEAGPQVGFLLSAKDEYDFDGESGEDDVKDLVKGVDFAACVGAGYTFPGGLNINARYNIGLSDIIDDEELSGEGAKWKNSVIQVGLSYLFDLGGGSGD